MNTETITYAESLSTTDSESLRASLTPRSAEAPARGSDKDDEIRRLRLEVIELRREVLRLNDYKRLAYRDHVTGLHHRRYFDERLTEECAKAARSSDYTFSVVVVDVDEFKGINDTHGHAVGDEVLFAVARLLKANVREVDICCRLGGDEFALLLPSTPQDGAHVVIDRLRQRLPMMAAESGLTFDVGISLGLASSPPLGARPEVLLDAADAAMYADKRTRRRNAARTGR